MHFLRVFCERLDAYCEARSALDGLTRDEAAWVLPSLSRGMDDELEGREVRTDIARSAKRQFEMANSNLWELLTHSGFSQHAEKDLPDLALLGIDERNRNPFLYILDWLQHPSDLAAEVDGPITNFEELAETVGYETRARRRHCQEIKKMIELDIVEHLDSPEQPRGHETETYIHDLQFHHDGYRATRLNMDTKFLLSEQLFSVLFNVAKYLKENPTSPLCPTETLYSLVWNDELSDSKQQRTVQFNSLHKAKADLNNVIRERLKLELKNEPKKGYHIVDLAKHTKTK
jgi:hypothetical protein